MGKKKGGYNVAARTNKRVRIDNTEAENLKIDESILDTKGTSDDNPLILPSKKRKTVKVQRELSSNKRPLTKKEKKKLERVIEQKQKKERRSELLEALSKVQVPQSELRMMVSTSSMHNNSWRKEERVKEVVVDPAAEMRNVIKGAKRKQPHKQSLVVESSSDCEITTDEEEDNSDYYEINSNSKQQEEKTMDSEVTTEMKQDEQERTITETEVESGEKATSELSCAVDNKLIPNHQGPKKDSLLLKLHDRASVVRTDEIQATRLRLPIIGEEQTIIETISENMVTIICGETGSGKTTQVPQFLYEAGYTGDAFKIAITEPRRVAAISMSKRVAEELNLTQDEVSYQIRYEGNTTPKTVIKFVTDGVLLKEIQDDFMLTSYRAVIIDEAHERSVYTDVLIGLLSRIVSLRHKRDNPLKLIIMSATLRVEDFRDNKLLFSTPPPVIKVEARQFPVTIHFNKRTPDDYMGETYRKICKIHRTLPPGGILVFVTGKQEVHTLCKKLQRIFPAKPLKSDKKSHTHIDSRDDTTPSSPIMREKTTSVENKSDNKKQTTSTDDEVDEVLPKITLDSYSVLPMDEQAELQADDSDENITSDEEDVDQAAGIPSDKLFAYEERAADKSRPLHVLPLYSLLSSRRQQLVFDPPPEGCRLCVISTDVAETSLTIPNIKYVIDTGMTKNKFYDKVTGVSTFRVTFTSQASADQRAGRAGRTAPGHCYRLYSSAVFKDEFEKFSPPETVSRPVDDLILQMKNIGIEKCINFPFPTPPSKDSLLAAEDLLTHLGALEDLSTELSKALKRKEKARKLTELGKTMSLFPVAPRYSKMLALAHQQGLLEYVIAIVAGFSVQEVFLEGGAISVDGDLNTHPEEVKKSISQLQKQKRTWAGQGESSLLGDAVVLLKAIGAAEFSGSTPEFCERQNLRHKAISEVRKLRVQLTNIVNSVIPGADICVNPNMSPPTMKQIKLIRQVLLSGLGDRIARLNLVPSDAEPDVKRKLRNSYQTTLVNEPCHVHPSSVLYKQNHEFVIYQEIVEANNKIYLKGVTAIEPEWISKYCRSRCQLSKPQLDTDHVARYDAVTDSIQAQYTGKFGPHSWPLPNTWLEMSHSAEKYSWFARLLLEGEIFSQFLNYQKKYLVSPSIITKSWSRLNNSTGELIQTLFNEQIISKNSLVIKWRTQPNYLLKEMLLWFPESIHSEIEESWPPLNSTR